jgi:uncharacterized protein
MELAPPASTPMRNSLIASMLILWGCWLLLMALGSLTGLAVFASSADMGNLTDIDSLQKNYEAFMQQPQAYPQAWFGLIWLQVFSSPLPFIGATLLAWRFFEKQSINQWFQHPVRADYILPLLLLILGVLPCIGLIYAWNKAIDLPDGLVETWMRQSEASAAKLTEYLTQISQPHQLLTTLIVVAFLASFGEELFFRAGVQGILWRGTGNAHLAVWGAALAFSAIHMQFYGFFPRLILGAILGYLYHWTKNLWVPILGHLFNNGFALIAAYVLASRGKQIDISEASQLNPWSLAVSAGLTVFCLFFFWKNRIKLQQSTYQKSTIPRPE